MPLQNPISFLGFNGLQNTKATSHLLTCQSIHKKYPPIQWQGQLLLQPDEFSQSKADFGAKPIQDVGTVAFGMKDP